MTLPRVGPRPVECRPLAPLALFPSLMRGQDYATVPPATNVECVHHLGAKECNDLMPHREPQLDAGHRHSLYCAPRFSSAIVKRISLDDGALFPSSKEVDAYTASHQQGLNCASKHRCEWMARVQLYVRLCSAKSAITAITGMTLSCF